MDRQQYRATLGETFQQQYLATINDENLREQQYFATSKARSRREATAACRRILLLSDRRLLVLDPRGGLMGGVIPLSTISRVSTGEPGLIPIPRGMDVVSIEHVGGSDGLMRQVEYSGRQRLVEAFAERLRKNVAAIRFEAFKSEHQSIPLDDRERFTELLRLGTEAGEFEVPAVLPSRERDSLLTAPVISARHCPVCHGRLRKVADAAACRNCALVWCDPDRRPVVDESGRITGTESFLFFDTNSDERDVVHCFMLTKEGAI